MPTLTITKSYSDGAALTEAQLDDAKDSIETFINTTKLDEDNIQDAAVTTAKLDTGAVTTDKIAADAVTSAKLSSSASVDADRAVGTNHIKDGAITADKIAANAVTLAKRSGANYAQSASCASFSTASGSYVDVTNLSVTLTPSASGQLIILALVPTTSGGYLQLSNNNAIGKVQFLADATSLGETYFSVPTANDKRIACIQAVHVTSSGSAVTYKAQAFVSGGYTLSLANHTLLAFEVW